MAVLPKLNQVVRGVDVLQDTRVAHIDPEQPRPVEQ
jgi:hypothetical protein